MPTNPATTPAIPTPSSAPSAPRPAPGESHAAARSKLVARLALADGAVFQGEAFGATGRGIVARAEVVFNTAMVGYQESLTDPSYTGQILVQTFPLIGNYGTNPIDVESHKVQVAGFVIRELARLHSNFRATQDLSSYLAEQGVLAIAGIDTRALTKKLRITGSMQGVLTDTPSSQLSDAELVAMARANPSMDGQNLVPLVGCSTKATWSEDLGAWSETDGAPSQFRGRPDLAKDTEPGRRVPARRTFKVLALDCGAKRNILRHLTDRGCEVVIVPHTIAAPEILAMYASRQIDGVFISNGPGDPAAVQATVNTLRGVLEAQKTKASPPIPTFGICLGHQLLALAAGAKTYKLKFGHRGANQPILNTQTRQVEITSQNHGFAVEPESLAAAGGVATHIHLNDQTIAGFRLPELPVFSVQYHPEASPGPHDSAYLFDQFVESMERAESGRVGAR